MFIFFLLIGLFPTLRDPARIYIGDMVKAAQICTDDTLINRFCNHSANQIINRKRHELAHNYYFICVECPIICQTNDALQKTHSIRRRGRNHKIVVLRRGSEEEFLHWIANDPNYSHNRVKFDLETVQGIRILTYRR